MRPDDNLHRWICDRLQHGLEPVARPFAKIAESLGTDEQTVLSHTKQMLDGGLIRRIRPIVNYRVLGKAATLVTAIVSQSRLSSVIEKVNGLDGVSHNYLRDNIYNLWFTLQGDCQAEIENILCSLCDDMGIKFYSLPAERFFKLNVIFAQQPNPQGQVFQNHIAFEKLTQKERLVLNFIQRDIEPRAEPFGFLCQCGLPVDCALEIISGLIAKNVIRRIAAIVDHRKLGFVANTMFVAKVDGSIIELVAADAGKLSMISHCYERKTFPGWQYNFFAMMHAASGSEIENVIKDLTSAWSIREFQRLDTVKELKKQPVIDRI